MLTNQDQISVPIPPVLRAFLQRRAEAEDRSIAAIVRRLIAEAERREAADKARAR
jgi:hypothetical protein